MRKTRKKKTRKTRTKKKTMRKTRTKKKTVKKKKKTRKTRQTVWDPVPRGFGVRGGGGGKVR